MEMPTCHKRGYARCLAIGADQVDKVIPWRLRGGDLDGDRGTVPIGRVMPCPFTGGSCVAWFSRLVPRSGWRSDTPSSDTAGQVVAAAISTVDPG